MDLFKIGFLTIRLIDILDIGSDVKLLARGVRQRYGVIYVETALLADGRLDASQKDKDDYCSCKARCVLHLYFPRAAKQFITVLVTQKFQVRVRY